MYRTICTFDIVTPTTEFVGDHPVYRTTARTGQVERSATREYYVTREGTDKWYRVVDWQLTIQLPDPAQLYLVTEEVLSPAQYSLIALGDVIETIVDDPDDTLQRDEEPGEDEEDM